MTTPPFPTINPFRRLARRPGPSYARSGATAPVPHLGRMTWTAPSSASRLKPFASVPILNTPEASLLICGIRSWHPSTRSRHPSLLGTETRLGRCERSRCADASARNSMTRLGHRPLPPPTPTHPMAARRGVEEPGRFEYRTGPPHDNDGRASAPQHAQRTTGRPTPQVWLVGRSGTVPRPTPIRVRPSVTRVCSVVGLGRGWHWVNPACAGRDVAQRQSDVESVRKVCGRFMRVV